MKPPIKNLILKDYPNGNVTQWFSENPNLYAFLDIDGHNGIDIVAPYGTPIFATTTQTVVEVRDRVDGYGRHVRTVDDKYEYVYGHLSQIDVKLGDIVGTGIEIGKMGNTGFVISGSTPFWKYNPYAGTHLHFGMREFVPKNDKGGYNLQYQTGLQVTIINYDNGYKGSIDPTPFFDGITDQTEVKRQLMLTIVSLSNQVISLLERLIAIKNK